MWNFMIAHWIEILIVIVVLAIIGNAIRIIIRNKKQGRCCGCSCGTGGCSGNCSGCGSVHTCDHAGK